MAYEIRVSINGSVHDRIFYGSELMSLGIFQKMKEIYLQDYISNFDLDDEEVSITWIDVKTGEKKDYDVLKNAVRYQDDDVQREYARRWHDGQREW